MLLTSEQIEKELKKLPVEWTVAGGRLVKVFKTKDYKQGIGLIVKVGEIAEKMDHHPDVRLSYSEVEISLTTHSESGLTRKDFDLARAIEKIDYSV